jgi:predicted DNA-binding ribbon-helix-helix protein
MVEIIRLSVEPLTTPDCPDPTPKARRVLFGDSTKTLLLEDAAWNALGRIAARQGLTIDRLCAEIAAHAAPDATFAQTARYYVFGHIAEEIPDGMLPPELRGLRRHGYRRTIQ